MADHSEISLRPVTTSDEAFLLEVYASSRTDEMALVEWSDIQKAAFLKSQFHAQQLHYRNHNPDAKHDVILKDDIPVGRLYVARRATEIRILDITVLPGYRNQRVGTRIIQDLMTEAAITNRALNVYVEGYNPSIRLFERLGFVRTGTNGIQNLMEWRGTE